LNKFIEAISSNPACSGSVRLAVACCCFKLQQYDRAKAAIDKALYLDVSVFFLSFYTNIVFIFCNNIFIT
jgi:hypothetical protein